MAFIKYIEEHEASPELRDLYDRYRDPAGRIGNLLRVQGHNPASLVGYRELRSALLLGRSELTAVQRELIAVVVSTANGCRY